MNQSPDVNSLRWKWTLSAIFVGWGVAICAAWWSMTAYSYQIDGEAQSIAAWPSDSNLTLADDRPTVLLFLHPRCPCSAASLTELEQAISDTPAARKPRVLVIATVPTQYDDQWTGASNVERGKRLPNASVVFDIGGVESNKFGVASSGHVMAFASSGDLLFTGGVTESRGHAGNNVGRASLVNALTGAAFPTAKPPVFGCRLCLPEPSSREESGAAAPLDPNQVSLP
ncbi:hypothetical protein M4951_17835 [Blastopirellula sp. J2-11]|uniref:hypothetical protein n=1 Tax=Blastopirellula sp. J2-11 TaxID=2943192 RepID=UPI0021C9BF9C|nr:hypothetical protein [Blastopirellula sp. J2-11]UUO05231.1 hypothetical protein M4951_17835 [Blastopirellula sp. J2-11]